MRLRKLVSVAAVALVVVETGPARSHDLTSSGYDVHRVVIDQGRAAFAAGTGKVTTVSRTPPGVVLAESDRRVRMGTYTSREIVADFPFNEVIPSFNVDMPAGTGFVIWLRCRPVGGKRWTRYYYAGTFGDAPRPMNPHTSDDKGSLNIDCFQSSRTFDGLQYRVEFHSDRKAVSPRLVRLGLCYSNTTGDQAMQKRYAPHRKNGDRHPRSLVRDAGDRIGREPVPVFPRPLDVPFRSQKSEDRAVASRLCSPTSVSMVLAYHGVDVPTRLVAELAYDREHDIYGNWARAVQTAYALGVPGYVRRFGSLEEAAAEIAKGQPLILSIRAKRGELPGAPFRETEGHLLVLTGFDENGDPRVNDPAGKTADAGQLRYPRAALKKVWLQRGGVAYVLGPRIKER